MVSLNMRPQHVERQGPSPKQIAVCSWILSSDSVILNVDREKSAVAWIASLHSIEITCSDFE
jgi:hypothetical protein